MTPVLTVNKHHVRRQLSLAAEAINQATRELDAHGPIDNLADVWVHSALARMRDAIQHLRDADFCRGSV